MKKIYLLLFALVFPFAGCSDDYDDTEIWEEVRRQAARIAALEAWQQTVNGNITSLQTIVSALENNDYITGVAEFSTPEPGGYRITFSRSGEATIWNGNKGDKGETGVSPVIGVAEFPERSGVYYWTLDGDFITDDGTATGNKMPVRGERGDDGAPGTPGTPGTSGNTPKVAIGSDGYWYISADGTATGTDPADVDSTGWENTNAKATGDKGDQGDAIFAANGVDNDDDDFVVFTLADGQTKITVPKYRSIGISFLSVAFMGGETKEIPFTSTGTVDPTNIRVVDVPAGWKVVADVAGKKFTVTAPPTVAGNTGEATVLVADNDRVATMYALPLSNTGPESNAVGAAYYQNGVAAGMVYIVNDGTPGSGRVVSLDQSTGNLQWASFLFQVGVTNTSNGIENMQGVQTYMGTNGRIWADFPAMNWIHSTLNGSIADYSHSNATDVWYLPSSDELNHLFCVYNNKPLETWGLNEYPSWGTNDVAANTDFNAMLTNAGGVALTGIDYWSSSEDGVGVFCINFINGQLYGLTTVTTHDVRGICRF